MFKHLFRSALLVLIAESALAAEPITFTVTDQSYDDVLFGLENAIIDHGLVISNHNHVGEMLERTKSELGSDVTVFSHADILGFCSAELSRAAMEANPLNIQFCPYNIFMFQQNDGGPVIIGYEDMPNGVMDDVEELLDTITRAAIGLDE